MNTDIGIQICTLCNKCNSTGSSTNVYKSFLIVTEDMKKVYDSNLLTATGVAIYMAELIFHRLPRARAYIFTSK